MWTNATNIISHWKQILQTIWIILNCRPLQIRTNKNSKKPKGNVKETKSCNGKVPNTTFYSCLWGSWIYGLNHLSLFLIHSPIKKKEERSKKWQTQSFQTFRQISVMGEKCGAKYLALRRWPNHSKIVYLAKHGMGSAIDIVKEVGHIPCGGQHKEKLCLSV